MTNFCRLLLLSVLLSLLGSLAFGDDAPRGWRGNWTGRFPDATPVTSWSCIPKSPAYQLRYQAGKPKADDDGSHAKLVYVGDIAHWLTLGPFTAKEAAAALDETFVGDESQVQPDVDQKAGEQAWTLLDPPDYRENISEKNIRKHGGGPYSLGFISRPVKLPGEGANQVAYAHTYLHAATAGKVLFLLNHADGMRAWVNGKEAYRETRARQNFNYYEMDHVLEQLTVPEPCARFEASLNKGWNRLLIKVASKNGEPRLNVRVTVPENTPYESANIRWAVAMPSWANATPVVVGQRIFITSEPDELVCVNRADGKILWRRVNTIYDALPDGEKKSNPLFREIEALAAELAKGVDAHRGTVLRAKMREILKKIDPEKYAPISSQGHISAIGYACATPVCDGNNVYAFFAPGVVVCYDLDGKRQWIQNVMDLGRGKTTEGKLVEPSPNCSSPVLADDKLVMFKGWFRAFDKRTGKVAWDTGQISTQFDMSHGGVPQQFCSQSCVPVRVGGVDYVLGFWGRFIRASDGKVMTKPLMDEKIYCTPVVDGSIAYIFGSNKFQLSAENGALKMETLASIDGIGMFNPMSSPLVHEGLIYVLNPGGVLSVVDADTGKPVYSQRLDMWPLLHYDAIGATPSVALGGKHIYLMDNLGACIVIEPGRTFKQVASNRIDTMTRPPWPHNTLERFEASPVFDRDEIFVRGHANLYCIGKK